MESYFNENLHLSLNYEDSEGIRCLLNSETNPNLRRNNQISINPNKKTYLKSKNFETHPIFSPLVIIALRGNLNSPRPETFPFSFYIKDKDKKTPT